MIVSIFIKRDPNTYYVIVSDWDSKQATRSATCDGAFRSAASLSSSLPCIKAEYPLCPSAGSEHFMALTNHTVFYPHNNSVEARGTEEVAGRVE